MTITKERKKKPLFSKPQNIWRFKWNSLDYLVISCNRSWALRIRRSRASCFLPYVAEHQTAFNDARPPSSIGLQRAEGPRAKAKAGRCWKTCSWLSTREGSTWHLGRSGRTSSELPQRLPALGFVYDIRSHTWRWRQRVPRGIFWSANNELTLSLPISTVYGTTSTYRVGSIHNVSAKTACRVVSRRFQLREASQKEGRIERRKQPRLPTTYFLGSEVILGINQKYYATLLTAGISK